MVGILKLFVVMFAFHGQPPGMLDPLWNRLVPWVAVPLMRWPPPALDE
jgi:hypothetical protein